MSTLALDPGNTRSAFALLDGDRLVDADTLENDAMLRHIVTLIRTECPSVCVCEMVACYGMAVGREVFETCVMVGRLMQAWSAASYAPFERITRPEVKLTLCGTARAKDPNVRAVLIDLFGPGKDKAVGRKKTPGPLYGVKGDQWAAIAVGVAWQRIEASRITLGERGGVTIKLERQN